MVLDPGFLACCDCTDNCQVGCLGLLYCYPLVTDQRGVGTVKIPKILKTETGIQLDRNFREKFSEIPKNFPLN